MNLERFIVAQDGGAPLGPWTSDYATALDEVRRGHKSTHWIWYVFPQLMCHYIKSNISKYYALAGREEAIAYYNHPVLRARLIEITKAIGDRYIADIFGSDTVKVRACMKLFASIPGADPVFEQTLKHNHWL